MLEYLEIPIWVWLTVACSLVGLFLLLPNRGSKQYGAARFASKKQVEKMELFAKDGLIIGKAFGQTLRVQNNLSTLIISPPGTGKTAAIAIPTLLICDTRSFIVNDVKGELHKITSKYRSSFSKVFKFAPGQIHSCCWNPLSSASLKSDALVQVSTIASVLYPKEDFWSMEARNAFSFFAMANIEQYGETSFNAIRDLTLGDPKKNIQKLLPQLSEKTKDKGRYLASKAPAEFSGILSSVQSQLQCFEDPLVANATSGSDFDFLDFSKELTTLYLCILPKDIERLRVLLNLFFEMATLSLLSQAQGIASPCQTTLLMDEFPRLGQLRQLINSAALSMGLGFNTMIFAQDYDQLIQIYGSSIQGILDGNSGYRCILPQKNSDTAERISRSIGTQTIERQSISSSYDRLKSRSVSHEAKRLISAQELLSMSPDSLFVIAQNYGQTPIKAKQVRWYQQKQFQTIEEYAE